MVEDHVWLLVREATTMLSSTYVLMAIAKSTVTAIVGLLLLKLARTKGGKKSESNGSVDENDVQPLLRCIRERRSVFPRSYIDRPVSEETMQRLLEAAMWAPYHGPVPPWRFLVLGKKAMRQMQRVTLDFYDGHWEEHWQTKETYEKWRNRTEDEIEGRWGCVSYMVGIVVRRQASGSKRLPMWEEECATACAVQNMHMQASAQCGLGCYWSSWHAGARDSEEMKRFLGMGIEDKCLGFFIVSSADPGKGSDNRRRCSQKHLCVDWRLDSRKEAS